MATWNRESVAQSSTDTYGDVTITGSLGIGTTSPAADLEIYAGTGDTVLRLATTTASASDDAIIEIVTDVDGTPRQARIGVDHSDNTLKLIHGTSFSGGTNGISIDSNGKIGIGYASPDTKLHIREDVDGYFDALRLENADNASSSTRGVDLTFRPYRGYTGGRIRCQRRANWSAEAHRDSSLDFYTVSNETESLAMRIDYNGYVGIGTTSPSSQLHLASATDEKPVILIEKTGSANHDGGNIQFRLKEDSGFIDNGKEIGDLQWYSYDSTDEDYNASAMIRVTASGTQAQNRAGGEMTFWTNSDTTATSKKMTIDSAGVVTIPGSLIAKQQVNIPSYMAGDINTSEMFISLQGYATMSAEMNYGHNYVFPCNGVLKHVYFIANDWNPNDSSNTQSWKCYRFRPDGSTNTGAYDTKGNWTVLETVSKANGVLQAQGRGIFVDFTDSTCSFNKGDLMGISLTNSVDVTDSVTDQITMVVSIELDWNNALTGNI